MSKRFTAYFHYVAKHKCFVFLACKKLGIPFLGLIHDLSKLSPVEFGPYARSFYGTDGQPTANFNSDEFGYAWLHHQKTNPHHCQAWVLINDEGPPEPLEIPPIYVLEMVADWSGAGKAITGIPDPTEWYLRNRSNMILHSKTQFRITKALHLLKA